ncbi:hypothetical protein JTB14_006148 [Gonioctena quinquepunctata]|nr:hypothetical protein JTB14_006148 [Gonioctena quinquepunctata]
MRMNMEPPLKEWGFMDLFHLFKVFEEAPNLMDDDDLKELIPNMENRLKFKKEFTEYLLSRENIKFYPVDVDESNTSNESSRDKDWKHIHCLTSIVLQLVMALIYKDVMEMMSYRDIHMNDGYTNKV